MSRSRSLLRDRRGAIATEYVALLGTVCIVFASALVGWGPPLVRSFERSRAILISPAP
jgi:Flp pilus assembly pilin Flp